MSNLLTYEQYKQKIFSQLIGVGLDTIQAEQVSDYMTSADFHGVFSHGTNTLKAYLNKIKNGMFNLTPKFNVIRDLSSFAVLDGDNAIGVVSANYCVDYAIARAKLSGIFTVFSRNNNTYGSAFYYALRAAKQGYICFTMTNTPAQMAPFGGKEKMLGTNPFALAIPGAQNPPLVIDMATSVVAKSKFNEYQAKGLSLPEGWALDCNGNPTTDPISGINGFVMPMAGFKGYGISLIIDAMAGFLSGAQYLNHVGRFYSTDNKGMNVGFNFIVIDPKLVYGENFFEHFDQYIFELRNSASIDGKHVVVPGDDRMFLFKKNMQTGLEWML